MKKSVLLYLFLICFFALWWTFAFSPTKERGCKPLTAAAITKPSPVSLLQSMSRQDIQRALLGDVEIMAKLFYSWKVEGDILASRNIPGVIPFEPLDCEHFHSLLQHYRCGASGFSSSATIIDDRNEPHMPCSYGDPLLAQTFVSASFLLALVPHHQIVAIPRGIREQTHLYPIEMTDGILLNADRHATEEIFTRRPRIAFVASYSNPEAIEVLRRQQMEIFFLNAPERLEDIPDAIKRVGYLLQSSIKAELLCSFIKAAYRAIDNQWAVYGGCEETIIVLNHFSHYAALSERNLTIQLLQRRGLSLLGVDQGNRWSRAMSCEELVVLNPGIIFVMHSDIKDRLLQESYLQNIPAIKDRRVYAIDDALHYSPNQLLVLAYLDYFEVLR